MKTWILRALFCASVTTALWAQALSTSQINGTVQDASGLAIPGAEIKALQTATGLVRVVATGADGGFVITNLPVGPYQLEVSKEGFSKYVQSGITLQVGSNPTIDVAMKVGAVSEQVQVEANAALVETRSSGVSQVIDNRRVLELPLNGRQATELIYLAGMATPVNGAGLNSGVRNYPTVNIQVAGGLSNGLAYALDGATHNDPYNNLNLPLPFPDALQEFKVETSALPAQYGHHSSAAVNGVTKSGTNSFHGNLFEFIRNGAVNARNTFSATSDSLKRNQFGGTIGGPILQNKLFFFAGLQATIQRTAPALNAAFVPTDQMLRGDFSAVTLPACNNGRQVTLGQGFTQNQISPSLFSAPALKILAYPSFPKATDACGRVTFGRRFASQDYNSLARVDYQISDKHSLFGRYLLAKLDQSSDQDPNNLLAASTANLLFQVQSFTLGDTYLIGSGTVSSFRLAVNRAAVPKTAPEFFSPTDIGINMWVGVPKFMRIAMTGGFNIASNNATPSIYNTTGGQLAEDISLIRGSHQIGLGADWVYSMLNASSGLNASGPFTFNGQNSGVAPNAGLALADFLIGRPSALTQATTTLAYPRMHYVGLYVQDSWRATSRLTFNYGVRWDPYIPVTTKYGWTSQFDLGRFNAGVRTAQYTNAPAGLLFPGDDGYPGKGVSSGRKNNFAPRFAVAWDPTGSGKTSVRAAYGIFYDLPSHNNYIGFAQAPPFGNQTTVNNPSSFADPWAGVAGGNPYPLTLSKNSPFINFGSYENFIPRPKTTYAQQWNFSIQRQLGADWIVSGNYVGSGLRHIWGGNQVNPGVFVPGLCGTAACSTVANVNTRRVLNRANPAQGRFFGSIAQLDDGGNSSFNGLLLSAQRRATKGVAVQANYTYSHCISDLHNPELAVAGANFMIPNNRLNDRANCALGDRRHQVNMSAVFETPKFAGNRMRMLATGWQFSPIVRLVTGPYISILSGLDQALTGQGNQRAVQVLSDVYSAQKSLNSYLNPAAFAQPALGTYGNMGAYNVKAAGAITVNVALSRNFKIRETHSLQLRFEAFNLPNHVNPGPPNGISGNGTQTGGNGFSTPTASLNNPNFGRILSADDPRILQGALKYTF